MVSAWSGTSGSASDICAAALCVPCVLTFVPMLMPMSICMQVYQRTCHRQHLRCMAGGRRQGRCLRTDGTSLRAISPSARRKAADQCLALAQIAPGQRPRHRRRRRHRDRHPRRHRVRQQRQRQQWKWKWQWRLFRRHARQRVECTLCPLRSCCCDALRRLNEV